MNILKIKGDQIFTHCSLAFEVQRTFVTLHLTLLKSQKNDKGMAKDGCLVQGVQCLVMGELKQIRI
jgi:hypothetical protein